MPNVAQLIINITATSKEVTKAIQGVNKEVENMSNGINKSTRGASNSFNSLSKTFKTGLGIAAVVSGVETLTQAIGRAINTGIEFNKTMDNTLVAFKVMMGGNIQQAKDLTNQLIVLANMTPLSVEHFVKAGTTLKAVGVESDSLVATMKMLGDVAMGNSDKFQRLAYAYAQVQAAGRLMGQENLQFTNAMFSPLNVMAQQMAKVYGGVAQQYMPQLKKAMEDGAISAKMVSQAFMLATGEGGQFKNAMIEMAKTFEGQVNIFKEQASILIAGGLKPIMDFMAQKLLPVVNYMLQRIIQVFGLVGINIEDTIKKIEQSTISFGSASATASKKAAKGMQDNQKAASDNLQSFDELHTMQKDMGKTAEEVAAADVGGGISAPKDLAKMMDEATKGQKVNMQTPEIKTDVVTNAMNKLKEVFKPLKEPLDLLKDSFGNLKQSITDLGSSPFMKVIGAIFTAALAVTIRVVAGAFDVLAGVFKILAGLFSGDFGKMWEGLKDIIGGLAGTVLGLVTEFGKFIGLDTVADGISKAWEWVKKTLKGFWEWLTSITWEDVKTTISNTWDSIKDITSKTWNAIKTTLKTIWDAFLTFINWEQIKTTVIKYWEELKTETSTAFNNLKTSLKAAWDSFLTFIKWEQIKEKVLEEWDNLKTQTSTAFNSFKTSLKEAWDGFLTFIKWDQIKTKVLEYWDTLVTETSTKFTNFKTTLKTAWDEFLTFIKWDQIKTKVLEYWDDLKKGTSEKFDLIKTTLKEIWDKFTNDISWDAVQKAIEKTWEALKTSTKDIFNSLVSVVIGNINFIIDAINGFIKLLNNTKITIPAIVVAGKTIFSGTTIGFPTMSTFEHLTVPKLATGGVVTDPTMAMIGEGRYNEAVIPLGGSQMDVLVNAISNAVIQGMQTVNAGVNRGSDKSNVVINIDGKQIAKVIVPYIDEEKGRTGKSVIMTV